MHPASSSYTTVGSEVILVILGYYYPGGISLPITCSLQTAKFAKYSSVIQFGILGVISLHLHSTGDQVCQYKFNSLAN